MRKSFLRNISDEFERACGKATLDERSLDVCLTRAGTSIVKCIVQQSSATSPVIPMIDMTSLGRRAGLAG